jgi:hypothetical protein
MQVLQRLTSTGRALVVTLVVPVVAFAMSSTSSSAPLDPSSGTITVHVVGDRDATGHGRALSGVLVRAYSDAAHARPAGECTTDAAGSCTITALPPGTYRVAPVTGPADGAFEPIVGVTTSFGGNVPYAETVTVGEGNPSTRAFVLRRANPPFPARCGVRVTLVYDLSGSISPGEADTMKSASLEFVDALAGTPSAIAVTSFATDAPAAGNADLPSTMVTTPAGVSAVKGAIAALSLPEGEARYTNWDAAFRSIVGQSDIVVMFTDGNPTVHGVPAEFPPVVTGFEQIEAGVLSANAVKVSGARVLAVGVGNVDELSKRNLAAISGPEEGSDYVITTFAGVRTVFRDLAGALCSRPETPVTTEVEPLPIVLRFTG